MVAIGPLLGWEGTFVGVHSLVTLAQIIGEHGVVCCSHGDLIHGLWVVLGAAHIGLDVNLSHRVGLVCGPYLHRKAAASVSPVITNASVQVRIKRAATFSWHSCLAEVSRDRALQTAACKENCCTFLAYLRGRIVQGIAVCRAKVACLPGKGQMYQLCCSHSRLSTSWTGFFQALCICKSS